MQTVEPKINISDLQARLLNRPAIDRQNSNTFLVIGEGVEGDGKPTVDVLSNEFSFESSQEFVTGVAHGYKVDDIYVTAINNPRSSEMRELQRLIAIGKLAIVPTTSEMQYKNFMYENGENVPRAISSIFELDSDSPLIEAVTRLFKGVSANISHFNDDFKCDVIATLLIAYHIAHSGNTQIVLCGLSGDVMNKSLELVTEKYTALITDNHFFAPYLYLCSEEIVKSNKLENIGTMFISSDAENLLTREMPSPTLVIINTRSPNFSDKEYIEKLKEKDQNRTTLFI